MDEVQRLGSIRYEHPRAGEQVRGEMTELRAVSKELANLLGIIGRLDVQGRKVQLDEARFVLMANVVEEWLRRRGEDHQRQGRAARDHHRAAERRMTCSLRLRKWANARYAGVMAESVPKLGPENGSEGPRIALEALDRVPGTDGPRAGDGPSERAPTTIVVSAVYPGARASRRIDAPAAFLCRRCTHPFFRHAGGRACRAPRCGCPRFMAPGWAQ